MAGDPDLWREICKGDIAAFTELYGAQAPRLHAFARRMTGNKQAAEDIVQETFTEFWKKPERYKPNLGPLRGWLFGIARNHIADWWRKQDASVDGPEEQSCACYAEVSSLLQDALARLPGQQRQLIWLREVEGHSYEELASILDIPIGTVRSRLFAAREALRRIWHAELRGEEIPNGLR